MEAIFNYDNRLKGDKGISSKSGLLEKIDDDISIVYQHVEGRAGVSDREMVNARLKKEIPDGFVVVHNFYDYSKKPETKDVVRAKNHDVGYVLKKVSDTKTRICWFVQTELNGWVGMINVKSITASTLLQLLKSLIEFLKSF